MECVIFSLVCLVFHVSQKTIYFHHSNRIKLHFTSRNMYKLKFFSLKENKKLEIHNVNQFYSYLICSLDDYLLRSLPLGVWALGSQMTTCALVYILNFQTKVKIFLVLLKLLGIQISNVHYECNLFSNYM